LEKARELAHCRLQLLFKDRRSWWCAKEGEGKGEKLNCSTVVKGMKKISLIWLLCRSTYVKILFALGSV